jgi:hypothetical protein
VGAVKCSFKFLFSCLVSGSLILFLVAPAVGRAQDSNITATICDSQGPEIVLSTPVSDSVTNLAIIPIQGTAVRTSQIDIYRNNQYDQSVSVSESNPQLSTTLSLTEGTNTIRLEAFYSCNQTTETLTRIVTYKPEATGGNQSNTDTEVIKPGYTAPDTVSNPAKRRQDLSNLEKLIEDTREKFSFKRGHSESYVKPAQNWILLLLDIVAIFSILAPLYFIKMLKKLFGIKLDPTRQNLKIIVRALGVILVIIFTYLLIH